MAMQIVWTIPVIPGTISMPDSQALAKAEKRFNKLTGAGFTAAVRTAAGEVSRIRSFDPSAEETLFFPRLVGG